MSFVEARNYALWVEQIHGNPELKARITAMEAGESIELEVEGVRSQWRKIVLPGKAGPRHGLTTSGEAQRHWHALRNYRHGGLATLRVCD